MEKVLELLHTQILKHQWVPHTSDRLAPLQTDAFLAVVVSI